MELVVILGGFVKRGNQITERDGRPREVQISAPIEEIYFTSMPVLNPACSRANTTFSVQTFPTGFIE